MSFLRSEPEVPDPYDPRITDDVWEGAPPYSEEASPDQDERRHQQWDEPPAETVKVEPDPDEVDTDYPGDLEDGPIPYVPEGRPPPAPREPAPTLPVDGIAQTVSVDDPTRVLAEDRQRRTWVLWIAAGSSAGVRLAFGADALAHVQSDGSSVPLAAGETINGETTGPVAAVSDTPGTLATVHVIAERNAR